MEPDINPSSTGDTSREMTLSLCPLKYCKYLLSWREWYRIVSSSFVDAWTMVVFLCVNRGRSTPYFFEYSVFNGLEVKLSEVVRV